MEYASLGSLPVELKVLISRQFDDASDVRSLALTNRATYLAFIGSESHIVKATFQNQTNPDVLHDVLAVALTMQTKKWSRDVRLEILRKYFSGNPLIHTTKWTLSNFFSIQRLRKQIQFFVLDFALSALSEDPSTRDEDILPKEPTMWESIRLERTFWRFELYCNLFGFRGLRDGDLPERLNVNERSVMFFNKFAAYENEQLGCVRDYLIERISEPFNDVASHNIEYSDVKIGYTNDYAVPDNWFKEGVLTWGLEKIHDFICTETYDERFEHLTEYPPCDSHFLYTGLIHANNQSSKEALELQQPFSPDPDIGPRAAWAWANCSFSNNSYFLKSNWYFRQRAYVMWDSVRLTEWKLLLKPRHEAPDAINAPIAFNVEKSREERLSRSRRQQLYLDGYTGYWAAESDMQLKQREGSNSNAEGGSRSN
ncbi:uncharacterized protein KY384_007173 [Bacidia gigantensis]|uniref:uncharacterized protein n=1 Tax=Bacidia gigantensis TaxID=2732470 RepID=UPI001D044AC6|nr:uncharacterized protein KY384_007173 [Bacidia gigantensis]KAG8528256.1 hypothetical protein KY384_007173 [Bacidia gigantensis]